MQALALLALVLGVLLLILGCALQGRDLPPETHTAARGRRVAAAVIALVVAGAAVVGWSG